MKCPHCSVAIHEDWHWGRFRFGPIPIPGRQSSALGPMDSNSDTDHQWSWQATVCPACREPIIRIGIDSMQKEFWHLVYPRFPVRAPIDDAVPELFRKDYVEACNVLPISPKASAALSRRVLQAILKDRGYSSTNLARQIEVVLNESDTSKALPESIRSTVDAVRNFGNFAAHPITELTSLQVIDVEPEEAEWCLEIVEALFEHYYATPAKEKERLARLNSNLKRAGKLPAKS